MCPFPSKHVKENKWILEEMINDIGNKNLSSKMAEQNRNNTCIITYDHNPNEIL